MAISTFDDIRELCPPRGVHLATSLVIGRAGGGCVPSEPDLPEGRPAFPTPTRSSS